VFAVFFIKLGHNFIIFIFDLSEGDTVEHVLDQSDSFFKSDNFGVEFYIVFVPVLMFFFSLSSSVGD